jgi:hypothetical protein
MQWFYDGQIRRYLTQTIRVLSNFVVKYGDGTLVRVPVMYGDADRQAATIIKQNTENKVNSVPRISVYITGLTLDRDRMSDSTYVGKVHIRERDISVDPYTHRDAYNQAQGKNYTVERLMPTPFNLKMKVDIWAANTDQKLQILEQILVLFNPSLELQTTDNYVDWTSLTVLNLSDINWSSRQVPVGNDSPIDIGTLTVDTPIWISPPAKVKHLGVITKIITGLYEGANTSDIGYIDGLGVDAAGYGTTSFSTLLTENIVTISDYNIQVYQNEVRLLSATENQLPREPALEISIKQGPAINWQGVLDQYPGKYVAGSSRLYLIQPNGAEIVGTVALNPMDTTVLTVNWDTDTLVTNTGIDSTGLFDYQPGYNAAASHRPSSPGTFDRIIDPLQFNPGTVLTGTRYLIIEDIGNADNAQPAAAWGPLVAHANDIVEWTGSVWHLVFTASQNSKSMVWQTNIYTGVQYLWNGVQWVKSFEGEYTKGQWRLEL